MKNIEEKLWDYIDGTCTADEQKAISLLIETDKGYKNTYNELLQINREFAHIELDEPSMPFTYNVIETIRAEQAQKPLKATINSYIVKGIAAFFVLLIVGLLITSFATMDWSVGSETDSNFTIPNLSLLLNKNVLSVFLFLDTVLGLFFLDIYLRRRQILKHQ